MDELERTDIEFEKDLVESLPIACRCTGKLAANFMKHQLKTEIACA